jgi:anti-sigma regulatory factor (Ser/Thr protein kinase)
MSPETLRLELKRNRQAPAVARAAASGRCEGLGLSMSVCETLILLVSEVVSNAVIHPNAPPDTPIVLTTSITDDTVRVTVTDTGDGFVPQPRKPDVTQGGYGLHIVGKTARRWGVDRLGGTRVWFELPRNTRPCHQSRQESRR